MNTALRRMPFRSLRSKLALLLILAAAIPIVLIGYISYRWIYIVQTEKIETEWVEKAERERDELERKLEELARVSQLLDVEGGIGREVVRFISSGDSYERSMLYRDITDSIANVNFSNPNLGAMFFYAPQLEEPLLFPNLTGPISFSLEVLTPFYKQKAFTYYGPHSSTAEERDGEPVFSLLRKLDYGQGKFLYAYIETGIGGLESLFETEPRGDSGRAFPVYHALVGPDGRVVYGNFRAETEIVGQPFRQPAGQYQTFRAEGRHGWTLYQLIPRSDYDREMNKWLKQFALFASLSLLAGISLAWLIWRMVYRPIRIINREISRFSYNQTPAKTAATGLPEFDRILDNFQAMGRRIAELILDIEDKEKRRGQLEVEKLLVQINPHFLHNTLNTIQWLARIQGQANIATLVSVFTRVLHYNLGKKTIIVTVREEADAVRDYIELQNIRYDHIFNVRLDIGEDALDIPIPRFILQPLVENALYHGFDGDEVGAIDVTISREDRTLLLQVSDNGKGIPDDKLADMLEASGDRKSGLGIGLRYVKQMLSVYYGEEATLTMESTPGEGTRVTIRLPDEMKGGDRHGQDQSADRG